MRTTTWLETSNPSNLCGFLGFLFLEILFPDFLKKIPTSKKIWTWMAVTLDILENPFLEICRGIGVFYHGSSTETPRILDWHGYSHPTTSYKIERVNTLISFLCQKLNPQNIKRVLPVNRTSHCKVISRNVGLVHLELAMYPNVNLKIPWKYIPQIILVFLKSHGSIQKIFHHLLCSGRD